MAQYPNALNTTDLTAPGSGRTGSGAPDEIRIKGISQTDIRSLLELLEILGDSDTGNLTDLLASINQRLDNVEDGTGIDNESIQPRHLGTGFDYSTTEQDTGKKWFDGRIIYRRTIGTPISIGTVSASSALLVDLRTPLSIPTMDSIIDHMLYISATAVSDYNMLGGPGTATNTISNPPQAFSNIVYPRSILFKNNVSSSGTVNIRGWIDYVKTT